MPPKAAATPSEDPMFKFVMSVLKTCESIKPNWDIVASENGYGYARNAQARFQAILKKQGFKIEKNGKIIALDGSAPAATATAPATPKTPKKTSKKAEPAAVKEEDETDEDEDEDDAEDA